MTIYILKWEVNIGNPDNIKCFEANSSYINIKKKHTELRKEFFNTGSDIEILNQEEAIEKHVISGQDAVIKLINSLK